MKILTINDHPWSGGSAQLFIRTNAILRAAGHDVFEITCDTDLSAARSATGGIMERFKESSKRIGSARLVKYGSVISNNLRHIRYPALQRYLKGVLETQRFDIAHIHNLHGNLSTAVLPIISSFKTPVVYQINDYYFFCNTYFAYSKKLDEPCKRCIRGNAFWALYYGCSQYFGHGYAPIETVRRFALNLLNPWKHISSCIVTSDKTKELLIEFGFKNDRIYKSRNAMTIKEFDVPVSMGNSFVFYGTFHTLKGTETFLKSLDYVDEGVEIGYYVLGTTQNYLDRLIETCKRRGLKLKYDCRIQWREGLKEIIASAYSVIVPSKWWVTSENVVYEGMLLGKAMIVGNSGGNAELLRDNETGVFFNANDPRDLASKINLLNSDRVFGQRIGKTAYAEARKMFSEERFLANLLDIYNKTIFRSREG